MRRLLLLAAGCVIIWAMPAHAIPANIWEQAGRPAVTYIDDPNQPGGRYIDGTIVLNLHPDTNVSLRKTLLHELGHAWADHHDIGYDRYAEIRGLEPDEGVAEDYAELFMWVMSDGRYPRTGEAPYAFRNSAGPPTEWQIDTLRSEGLLPR